MLDHDDPLAALVGEGERHRPLGSRRLTLRPPVDAARGLVRRRHLRAQPRRAASRRARAGRLRARLRRRAARAVPQGRGVPAHGRPGRADRRPLATRRWNVPEPELGVVLGEGGALVGLHDRQRRLLARHRGREPALPAAGQDLRRRLRDRAGACSCRTTGRRRSRSGCGSRDAAGDELFAGETSTARMRRSFAELAEWLLRDNPVPPGASC